MPIAWLSEFKYQVFKLANVLAKRIGGRFLFYGHTGIKGFYNKFVKEPPTILGECTLDPNELHLGFDALRDEHTLVGVPVAQSPPSDFIKRISEGADVVGSDYILRLSSGALDERFAVPVAPRRMRRFRERFEKRMGQLERGEMRSIVAYRLGDRWYINDGKHRAALACLMGCRLTVREADTALLFSDTRAKMTAMMAKRAEQYSKQLAFIQDARRHCDERKSI